MDQSKSACSKSSVQELICHAGYIAMWHLGCRYQRPQKTRLSFSFMLVSRSLAQLPSFREGHMHRRVPTPVLKHRTSVPVLELHCASLGQYHDKSQGEKRQGRAASARTSFDAVLAYHVAA